MKTPLPRAAPMPRERPAGPHLDIGLERALPRWQGAPSFHARALPPPTLSRTHSRLADEGSNDGLKPAPNFGLFAPCTAAGCALATAPNAGPGLRWAPPIGGPPPPDRALSRTHSRLADEGSNDELKPAPSFGLFAPCPAEGCALATAPSAGPGFQWAHVALAPVGSARTRHPVRVHGMRAVPRALLRRWLVIAAVKGFNSNIRIHTGHIKSHRP